MVSALFLGAAEIQAAPASSSSTCDMSMLVVGLGSGALASYLGSQLSGWYDIKRKILVDAVELDPVVVEVADKWFGFDQSKVQVTLQEGCAFLRACSAEKRYRCIFLDVDAKDLTQPVLFPPIDFLDDDLMVHVRDNLLEQEPGSMLILNLASKSTATQAEILARLHKCFPSILCIPMSVFGDANCVVVAFSQALSRPIPDAIAAGRKLASQIAERYNDGQVCAAFPHDFDGLLEECRLIDPSGTIIEPSKK